MGTIDRVLRAVFGAILLYFSYMYLEGWLMVAGYVVAAIMILTAVFGYCFLYTLCGISTKK